MTKNITINTMKSINGGMNLKYNTKVQSTGGTLSTSIPKIIRDILELEKGDTVTWNVNIDEKIITLNKK